MDNKLQQLTKAQKLKQEAKWDEALTLYLEIVKYDDSNVVYEDIAWCLSTSGKFLEAIKYLTVLLERQPRIAKWSYMIGYQWYCLKKWIEAAEWFEKTLSIKKDYFVVKYRLAYAYLQIAGEYKKLTKPEFWKAIGHLRDCKSLWHNFSESQCRKEQSKYFDVNFLLGKVLLHFNNFVDEAIVCLKEALTINNNDENTKYNLSKAYYLKGCYKDAEENLPNSKKYYVVELKSYIYAKLGKYHEAIVLIEDLLHTRKRDYLYRLLAEIYLISNDLKKSLDMIKQAHRIDNKNHKNYYTAAKIYNSFGLFNEAMKNLDIAIELKQKKYSAQYIECVELKQKLSEKITDTYKEDIELLDELKKTISCSKMILEGTIFKYNTVKCYGFIKSKTNSIFFHISDCKSKTVMVGDKVKFNTINTSKGQQAINIVVV